MLGSIFHPGQGLRGLPSEDRRAVSIAFTRVWLQHVVGLDEMATGDYSSGLAGSEFALQVELVVVVGQRPRPISVDMVSEFAFDDEFASSLFPRDDGVIFAGLEVLVVVVVSRRNHLQNFVKDFFKFDLLR